MAPPFISGPRHYRVVVAGEGDSQGSFEAMCGAHRKQVVNIRIRAQLHIDDEEDVRVTVQALPVGQLSKRDARAVGRLVRYGTLSAHETFECEAVIRGGWDREKSKPTNYFLRLDLPIHDD